MKLKLFALVLLLSITSCSSDDDKGGGNGTGSLFEINVNGKNLSLPETSFIANESCEYIYATIMDVPGSFPTRFRMEFQLTKTGHLKEIDFTEYSDNNRQYQTAVFQPAETFTISNFEYDPATKYLYFEFEGDLLEMDHPQNKKHISGKLKYNNTTAPECGYFPHLITVDTPEMHFTSWETTTSPARATYSHFSDNGYLMQIDSEIQLKDIPQGTYSFNDYSALRINMFTYVGPIKASFDQTPHGIDWIPLSSTGTLTITSQNQLPYPHTKGTFTFRVEDPNGDVVFENFTGSFEM